MRIPRSSTALQPPSPNPLENDMPILYEDEEDDDMGEANPHAWVISTLYFCLPECLKPRHPALQVFQNMNCYYLPAGPVSRKTGAKPNFASDIMIVHPNQPMPFDSVSYTMGEDGPAPKVVFEVLSEKTAETRDKEEKPILYAKLGVKEYVLIDLTGRFLPKKLEFRRLQANGKWKLVKDAGGGATSILNFRLYLDATDPFGLHIVDAATGKEMLRPHEAEAHLAALEERLRAEAEGRRAEAEGRRAEAEARQHAEEQIRDLQASIDRMRGNAKQEP